MRKPARLALFAPAVAAALLALSSDRSPLPAGEAHAATDPKADKNYDLASLEVFRKTIVQIKDNYVDPSRINPKEMFTASLEAVERQVAEVMVEIGGGPRGGEPPHQEKRKPPPRPPPPPPPRRGGGGEHRPPPRPGRRGPPHP